MLIVFGIVAAAIVGIGFFLQSRPPLEIRVAVNPLAEEWLRAAADSFNASEPIVNASRRVVVRVEVTEDAPVWQGQVNWRDGALEANGRVTLWIPAAAIAADYAASESRLLFEQAAPSLARTPLVWGGFSERVEALTQNGALPLDWSAVGDAAAKQSWDQIGGDPSWRFLNLAFMSPSRSSVGLMTLFSATANYHQSAAITPEIIRDEAFRDWMIAPLSAVPNSTTLGADPAQSIAVRGTTLADVALLPENLWLKNVSGLTQNGRGFTFAYPAYQYQLTFPALRWSSANVLPEESAAADLFVNWLLADAQQQSAMSLGLRPAEGEPDNAAALFNAATPYGILLAPDYGVAVVPPSLTDARSLLSWYDQGITAGTLDG